MTTFPIHPCRSGDAGHVAFAVDDQWRLAALTGDMGSGGFEFVVGEFLFGPVQIAAQLKGRAANAASDVQANFTRLVPWLLADIPGGRDALREMVHPILRDLVDGFEPNDNAAIGFRVPGEELADDRRRSAIGRLSRRPDLAALALLFAFAALINALAMTAPASAVERWLAAWLGTTREAPVLGLLFAAGLVAVPVAAVGAAAAATHALAPGSGRGVASIAVRFAFALVPFGAGVWLAHYGFHFLTGVGAILPVAQVAAIDLAGQALLGEPDWRWMGVRSGAVFPFQLGAIVLGALGASAVAHRIAERDFPSRAVGAAAPWIVLVMLLTALALWIVGLPMEMRGMGLGG